VVRDLQLPQLIKCCEIIKKTPREIYITRLNHFQNLTVSIKCKVVFPVESQVYFKLGNLKKYLLRALFEMTFPLKNLKKT